MEIADLIASPDLRAAWAALPLDERLRIADAIPECGHAFAELQTALEHLDREAVVALERRRG